MKIDKTKLDNMLKLSDEELWREIRSVAKSKGISMPERMPDKAEISKVRSALSEAERLNLASAMRLVNELKRGDK